MSKMIIYFYLLIPLLCLTVDSSSIRGRNNKNELVPLNSRVGLAEEKDNSLNLVNDDPYIMQIPLSKENDKKKDVKGTDKNTKEMEKKRNSKLKYLRKKHRTRRDLSKFKPNLDEKSKPVTGDKTENQLKNITKSASRAEILKALSVHPKKKDMKRGEYLKDKLNNPKTGLNRNPSKHATPLIKMVYPNTPKPDKHSHKYTYKDLLADRKRLEQKINYIKNMFNTNDSTADESVRIRRRSESDRTANKIAKMFLTLSAVNGLHEKRRSKCRGGGGEDDERVQDVWEKERQESSSRRSSSSNEERYKVKKWIEFMKNKRSSGKTCPCLTRVNGDEGDAFPLEQKLPKGYFLLERKGSSEESSEIYGDPYYNSRDSVSAASKRRYGKDQDKVKEDSKNGKKKLSLPLTDLELYRSRAKQILQNAEEILDRIKEEEERRLSTPNILINQLKELTSRIHGDPRNNENDLIRKIQKNLGWNPLSKSKDASEGNTFVENVKSYILDPYEKAKALTDESTKMLSSYLLRNLGKIQESSEEQSAREVEEDETDDTQKKLKKPLLGGLSKQQVDPLSKSKEELQQWDETISSMLQGPEENVEKEQELAKKQETIKNRVEDIIKEQQKKLTDYDITESDETEKEDGEPTGQTIKEIIKASKPSESESLTESINPEETLKMSPVNQDNTQNIAEDQKESPDDSVKMESPETKLVEKEAGTPISDLRSENLGEGTKDENIRLEEQKPRTEEKLEQQNPETNPKAQEDTDDMVQSRAPQLLTEDMYYPAEDTLKNFNDREKGEDLKEPLKVSLEEGLTQARLNEETFLEELKEIETELEQEEAELENEAERLKALDSSTQNEGAAKLKEPLQNPSTDSQGSKQDPNIKTEIQQAEKLPEQADLVKEPSQEPTESDTEADSKSTDGEPKVEKIKSGENSQETERGEENLQNQHESREEVKGEKGEEKIQKLDEKLEDPNSETENEQKEDILKAVQETPRDADEKSAEKSAADEESSETENEESVLQATHSEGQKKESSENLNEEMGNQESDEAILKSENPVQETEQLSLESIGDGNDETNMEETNSAETFLRRTMNGQTDQEDLDKNIENAPKETNLEEDEEVQETRREGSDEMSLQEILDEERELEKETVVEAANPSQDTTDNKETVNSYEESDDTLPKDNSKEEAILKSENPDYDPSNQANEPNDDETSAEVGLTQSNKENVEMNEESLLNSKSNENLEMDDKTLQTSENSKEILEEKSEKEKNYSEETLKAKNPEAETSQEAILRSAWDIHNQEKSQNEGTLMQVNPDEEAKSSEDSKEHTSSEALNKFVEGLNLENDRSDETSLKASNPDADDQDSEKELKSTFSQENLNEETETLKSKMDEEQTQMDNDETLVRSTLEIQNEENSKETVDEKSSKNSAEDQETEMLESPRETSNLEEAEENKSQSLESQEDEKTEGANTYVKESIAKGEPEDLENGKLESVRQEETEGSEETPLKAEMENEDEKTNDGESYVQEYNPNGKSEDQESAAGASDTSEETVRETLKGADEISEEEELEKEIPRGTDQNSEETVRETLSGAEQTSEEAGKEVLDGADEQVRETLGSTDQTSEETEREALGADENSEETVKASLGGADQNLDEVLKESDDENQNSEETIRESLDGADKNLEDTLRESLGSTDQNSDDAVRESLGGADQNLDNTPGELLDDANQNLDETVRASLDDTEQNLNELDKTQQSVDPDEDETPLRSTNYENDFDNKIDETSLTNPIDQTIPETSLDVSDETFRSNEVDNQIEEEPPLKSSHYPESQENEESFETLRQESPGENLIFENDDHQTSQEAFDQDILQLPEPTAKSLKPNKLKVPKSIAQIMRDINGQEKSDMTSMDSLNPDKIDDMIGKIDEAEHQQNLQEVDCRKECACADDIDLRSKNLGRYEIVKDILHWMKDLQMNAV